MLHNEHAHGAGTAAPGRTLKARANAVLDRLMRLEAGVARFEGRVALASWCVVLLAILVSLAIRAFNLPIPDTGEWALVAMSPLTFVGAALCSHLHKHLTADIVEMLPRGPLLQALEIATAVLFIVFAVCFALLAHELLDYALTSRERLIDLGTPLAVPVAFMVLGALLMGFHAVLDLLRACLGRAPGGVDTWS